MREVMRRMLRARWTAGVACGVTLAAGLVAPGTASAATTVPSELTAGGTDVRGTVTALTAPGALKTAGGGVAVGDSVYLGSGSTIVRVDKNSGAVTVVAGSDLDGGCVDASSGGGARFSGWSGNMPPLNTGYPAVIGFDGRLLYVRDPQCGVRTVNPGTGETRTLDDVRGEDSRTPQSVAVSGGALYFYDANTNRTTVYKRNLATGETTPYAEIPSSFYVEIDGIDKPVRVEEFLDVLVADSGSLWLWGMRRMYRVDLATGALTTMPYRFNAGADMGDITNRGNGPYWDGQVVVVGDWFYFVDTGFYDWRAIGRLNKWTGERNLFAGGIGVTGEYSVDNDQNVFSYIGGLASDGRRLFVAEQLAGVARLDTAGAVALVRDPDPEPQPDPGPLPVPTPTPVNHATDTYVALGDSYSSGFGMGDYDYATNPDTWGGFNDCQRSSRAYSRLVADRLDLDRKFYACQGGVTDDFYWTRSSREEHEWGEVPQLERIPTDAGLVTFTIGGNDSNFSGIYKKCVFEITFWTSCREDTDVSGDLAQRFARLDGGAASKPEHVTIHPYQEVFGDVRERAPYANRVVIGYPAFFAKRGVSHRCEEISPVDQRWIHEKTLELNRIIKRNAELNGFRYVDPNSRFAGHELCSDDPWFYGVFHAGKIHPTPPGHKAIADAILDELANEVAGHLVGPLATVTSSFEVQAGLVGVNVGIEWPGSDIQLSLVSPSGVTYSRTAHPGGATGEHGPTWDQLQIPNPEAGTWKVSMYGADVAPQGEEAKLRVVRTERPNAAPTATFDLKAHGTALQLDASGSKDADGSITAYDWYITRADGTETVLSGAKATATVPAGQKVKVTLVTTDDDGSTAFSSRTVTAAAVDVKPDSADNPVNPGSQGLTPIAIVSDGNLDATKVRADTVRVGPACAAVTRSNVQDVNGDGRPDLVLHVSTPAMGLGSGDTAVWLSGTLRDGTPFVGGDRIRIVGAEAPKKSAARPV